MYSFLVAWYKAIVLRFFAKQNRNSNRKHRMARSTQSGGSKPCNICATPPVLLTNSKLQHTSNYSTGIHGPTNLTLQNDLLALAHGCSPAKMVVKFWIWLTSARKKMWFLAQKKIAGFSWKLKEPEKERNYLVGHWRGYEAMELRHVCIATSNIGV